MLLVVLALAMAVTAVATGATSTASFGVHTKSWKGSSELEQLAARPASQTSLVRDVDGYPADGTGSVAIVLSPRTPYTPAEKRRLGSFVESGGTLVVAEDFRPHSNRLLAAVGAESRFDGRPVRDPRHHYRSPALPVATNLSDHRLVSRSDSLTLNRGTVLDPGPNASVIARTSGYAYLDGNGNGKVDENESIGSFPVVAVERVGAGRVVLVSDPSLFINAMLDRAGNRAFAASVVSVGDRVLIDTSHTAGRLPLLQRALLALRRNRLLAISTGGLAMLLLWGVEAHGLPAMPRSGRRSRDRTPVTKERLVATLQERHPEWEADTIERVVEARLSDTDQTHDD